MQENFSHKLCIEQKKNITVNGVESVSAFSEVKIVLALIGGGYLHVLGSHLKITAFSQGNGSFTAEGAVTSVSYGGKNVVAKIFK